MCVRVCVKPHLLLAQPTHLHIEEDQREFFLVQGEKKFFNTFLLLLLLIINAKRSDHIFLPREREKGSSFRGFWQEILVGNREKER